MLGFDKGGEGLLLLFPSPSTKERCVVYRFDCLFVYDSKCLAYFFLISINSRFQIKEFVDFVKSYGIYYSIF